MRGWLGTTLLFFCLVLKWFYGPLFIPSSVRCQPVLASASEQCCNAVSLDVEECDNRMESRRRNDCIARNHKERMLRRRGPKKRSVCFGVVRDDKQWAADAVLGGFSTVESWKFILSECSLLLDAKNDLSMTSRGRARPRGLRGWMAARNARSECPAERPMKSRALVAPGPA